MFRPIHLVSLLVAILLSCVQTGVPQGISKSLLTCRNNEQFLILFICTLLPDETVSEQVLQVLMELTEEVRWVKNDMSYLKDSVNNLKQTVSNLDVHTCGGTGWTRVVYLDMRDPNTTCPSGWQLTGHSKRTCGRASSGRLTCDSVFFPVSGGNNTRVCGRIIGYQYGYTDAFEAYDDGDVTTIDGAYVSGVSLTHGSPRQHIWTFAAGISETSLTGDDACPCDATINIASPPFVGGDYFCESGDNLGDGSGFHPNYPLWDGEGCSASSTCCSFNNPPYFTKQLSSPTSDDIEARICRLDVGDDTPIEFIELYVQSSYTHAEQFAQLHEKMETLDEKLISMNATMTDAVDNTLIVREDTSNIKENLTILHDELNRLSDNVDEHVDRITTELMKLDSIPGYTCGGTGGWRRVAYLDMTDNNTDCPSGWQLTGHPKRTCGKASSGTLTCDSVFFPVRGGDYTRVCGRIKAYQHRITDAFEAYDRGDVTTIDGAYVGGVSLTHGSPIRTHIWTFAAGFSETYSSIRADACPCDTSLHIAIPPFVNGDYFCESGDNLGDGSGFHPDDPLWDGEGCSASSTCCSFNDPPYFTKQLSRPTSDDIEARICRFDGGDDTPIELIELYVQSSNTHAEQLAQLHEKMETLDEKLISMNATMTDAVDNTLIVREDTSNIKENLTILHDELNRLSDNVEEQYDRMTTELMKLDSIPGYTCGGTGGWRRMAYLDMTDNNTDCPSGWQLTGHPNRTCGRASSGRLTCDSVIFPVSGGDYTRVCGRIIGYQYSHTDAFEAYDRGDATTIDGAYVSGVSLTHGSPRQHIWTFAAGISEASVTRNDACPCDATINIASPPFMGGDYFCESGDNLRDGSGFHGDDPLWDGEGCSASSTCCSFNDPPYFTKQLSSPTSDDIEARICLLDDADDTAIELIELYVQYSNTPERLIELCEKVENLNSMLLSVNATMTDNTLAVKEDTTYLKGDLTRLSNKINRLGDTMDEHEGHVATELTELDTQLQNNFLIQLKNSFGYNNPPVYTCDGSEGWRRVAYLNMKDPNTTCPSGWHLTGHSKRTCGRVSSGLTCDSVIFPVRGGGDYTRVCGRIKGYQYNPTDAFEAYHDSVVTTINESYVSGVSLTHGSPRQHIWTFAAGRSEALLTYDDACPCDATIAIAIPPFVGGDYFCESGVNSGSTSGFHPDDPLWDGENCSASSTCCSFNDPPYFTKQLSRPTSDDIEARICQKDNVDDTPIEFIELYVQ